MLSISGDTFQLCDGLSRRSLLKIGGLAMGGLSLADLLRAEARSGRGSSHKSVIMVFLSGGPPHQDMVDLKPDAPAEIRGEFQPIDTNVPGIQICELMPQLAQRADRLAIIRSLVGSEGRHAAFQCMTGQPVLPQPPGGWPSLGSVVSKLQGPVRVGVPPFVGLSPKMRTSTWADPGQPGFCGQAHAPFTPNAEKAELELRDVSREKLGARQSLLNQLDRLKHDAERSGALEGADAYYQQAFGILTSSRLAEALDLEREDPQVRDRYGRGSIDPAGYGDAGPIMNDYFLAARRLVEAGVRVVTLAYGRWDWHGRPHGTNFENARDHLPIFDQGLSALLDDLAERGMSQDVSVIVWGEFGRTPRVNKNGGRDHWPQVACALLSGGGMRTGQVIGSTNKFAEVPKDRPVHFQDLFATLYHNLGIDIEQVTVNDLTGRPQYLVDHNRFQALSELA
ncbi:MAG: DUF1501 domain-containing protein [Planctomycetales bacterium]